MSGAPELLNASVCVLVFLWCTDKLLLECHWVHHIMSLLVMSPSRRRATKRLIWPTSWRCCSRSWSRRRRLIRPPGQCWQTRARSKLPSKEPSPSPWRVRALTFCFLDDVLFFTSTVCWWQQAIRLVKETDFVINQTSWNDPWLCAKKESFKYLSLNSVL